MPLLTITTAYSPATDLGYLLVKHPDKLREVDLTCGKAYVFFPEATKESGTVLFSKGTKLYKMRLK